MSCTETLQDVFLYLVDAVEILTAKKSLQVQRFVFLHDMMRPHDGARTCVLPVSFKWRPSSPQSPNPAPSNFHLFLHLKRFHAGNKFDSVDESKESVEEWLMSQAADFREQGLQTLVPCYDNAPVLAVIMSQSRVRYVKFDNNE